MARQKPLIYATSDSQYFAKLIAEQLDIPELGVIERTSFPDGERYYRIRVARGTALMGKTIVFVGSTHTDDALFELYRVGCTMANSGTRRLIFVIPFFGYSTMERAKRTRPIEVVTAKTNARMLSSISRGEVDNVFLCLDLHTAGIIHYFRGCMRFECSAFDILAEAVQQLGLRDIAFATTDVGGGKHIQGWARHFGTTNVAFANKPERGESRVAKISVSGNVTGKNVVICDDMTRSAGSLIDAADAYLRNGARDVYAVLSHLALNNNHMDVLEKLMNGPIKKIITTNSHPQSRCAEGLERFIVCDVSPIFTETIKEIL